MKRKSLFAVSAILTLFASATSVFAVTLPATVKENEYTLQKSQIVVNGKTEYSAYVFAAKDPNDGVETTYIPIWYIMQVLGKQGSKATWDGDFKTPGQGVLNVQTSTYKGGLNIQDTKGRASIIINSSEADGESGVPNLPVKDPSSGKVTSFFGLYYAEQLLYSLGFQNTWNGSTHTWTITPPKAAPVLSPTPGNIQLAITEAEANQKANKNTVYGMLSTPTQWYNDPSVKFYDKNFPVADLKDGYVIQENPYTVVLTNTGAPDPLVAKLVGYGSNSVQGKVTFWEGEEVNPQTGYVVAIVSYMLPEALIVDKGATAPSDGQGINFGDKAGPVMKNYKVYWGDGQGLDVVPVPSWTPLSQ